MTDFFTAPGGFYRGNLHTHSTLSDGALEPKEVCRRYRDEGYDFISLTDHFLGRYGWPIADTEPYRKPGFTTVLGAELHSGAQANGELWHILAVCLPAGFEPPADARADGAIDVECRVNALVVFEKGGSHVAPRQAAPSGSAPETIRRRTGAGSTRHGPFGSVEGRRRT